MTDITEVFASLVLILGVVCVVYLTYRVLYSVIK